MENLEPYFGPDRDFCQLVQSLPYCALTLAQHDKE
jgi:hypothetical protein